MPEQHFNQITLTDEETTLLVAGWTAIDGLMCGKGDTFAEAAKIANIIGLKNPQVVCSLRNKIGAILKSTKDTGFEISGNGAPTRTH